MAIMNSSAHITSYLIQRHNRSLCVQVRSPSGISSSANRHRDALRPTRCYSTSSEDLPKMSKDGVYTRALAFGSTALFVLVVTYVGTVYGSRSLSSLSSSPITPSKSKFDSSTSKVNYASHKELQLAIQELRVAFSVEDVETDTDTLQLYGSSENSYHPMSPHSIVIRVHCTEDVVKAVNISKKYRVPITAYSGGTSLEGHFTGVCFFFVFLRNPGAK